MTKKSLTRTHTARFTFTPKGEKVFTTVASYLGVLQRKDYVYLVKCSRSGVAPDRDDRRKFLRSHHLNTRLADAIIMGNDEQIALALRTTKANVDSWNRDIASANKELTKSSLTPARKYALTKFIADRAKKIDTATERSPSVCFGGKKLLRQLTADPDNENLRRDWRNKRLFMSIPGATGRAQGNDVLKYDSDTSELRMHLPDDLASHLGVPTRCVLGTAQFKYQGDAVGKAISENRSTSHEMVWDASKFKWSLHTTVRHDDESIVTRPVDKVIAGRVCGVDFNSGHIALTIVDAHANVLAQKTIVFDGSKSIPALCKSVFAWMDHHHTGEIVIEKLSGLQRRQASRVTRGGALNRCVSSLPTGEFARQVVMMSERRGIRHNTVNPSGTSKYAKEWSEEVFGNTTHAKASYLIARRGMGVSIRRRNTAVSSGQSRGSDQTNASVPEDGCALPDVAPSRSDLDPGSK